MFEKGAPQRQQALQEPARSKIQISRFSDLATALGLAAPTRSWLPGLNTTPSVAAGCFMLDISNLVAHFRKMNLIRIIRIGLWASIACFALTAAIDGRSIYLELHGGCRFNLEGKLSSLGLKWFILLFSIWVMLAFIWANRETYLSRITFVMKNGYDESYGPRYQMSPSGIYTPFLAICIFALLPPIASLVVYWRTVTSAGCIGGH
jgi:hypothetical protein